MKKILLLTLLSVISILLMAQPVRPTLSSGRNAENLIENYRKQAMYNDSTFRCTKSEKLPANMISDASFDTLFRPIMSNVFVGSNDLATNTTAGSITQDAEKGTLSVNYSFLANNNHNIWSIGAFSKSTDGIFGIYTSQAWSSEVGINIAHSWTFWRTRFFNPDKCEELRRKRTGYTRELLKKYGTWLSMDTIELKQQLAEKKTLQQHALLDNMGSYDYESLDKEIKDLDSIIKQIQRLVPDSGKTAHNRLYQKNLEEDIAKFENTQAELSGYKLWWFQLHGAISNNKIALKTDSLLEADKNAFRPRNTVKLVMGGSLSRLRDTKRIFWYISASVDFALRNYLDHPLVKEPFLRKDPVTQKLNTFGRNQSLLSDYDLVRANIKTFEPSLYSSIFFMAKKTLGLEATAACRVLMDKPDELKNDDYTDVYTLAVGPAFRIKKDEGVNKGTVVVEAGIIDAPFKSRAWDFFGARLKVGLPFNTLFK